MRTDAAETRPRRWDGISPLEEASAFRAIRDHHFQRRWHGRAYRSIDLDAISYWIMKDGTVIIRKPVECRV